MENQNDYVTKVREGYLPHERTKLDELKELDGKVKLLPTALAYALGIVATLVLGVGMCFALGVLGAMVMTDNVQTAVGVVVGCAGIALCIANYFIYRTLLKSRKAKYGERILALSDELLNK